VGSTLFKPRKIEFMVEQSEQRLLDRTLNL
jgi:hypothetical protein